MECIEKNYSLKYSDKGVNIMGTINVHKYYTSLPKLHKRFEEKSRSLGFKANNIEEYELWKTQLRTKLLEITGIDRMELCSLEPQLIESKLMDGYRRNKVIIQTEEDVWMPFYVLSPNDLKEGEKRPVVIAPHGHLGGGKESIAGRVDIPEITEAVERFNYNYGEQLVKEGYIVFCPDARGFGERREYWMQGEEKEKILNGSCIHLNNTAVSLGYSLTGFMTWDLMRLIDYIQTLAFCDSTRIGCCGFSGGGLQTLWLAALDNRVKCAVISGYFYGSKDSLLEMTNCGCNYVPHFWQYADMGDLGALIAPRALLIESGKNDHLNGKRGLDNVVEQLEVTQRAYRLFNSENKLIHHIGEGGHYWYAERTFAFLREAL
jgi:dienelactone hydrolase